MDKTGFVFYYTLLTMLILAWVVFTVLILVEFYKMKKDYKENIDRMKFNCQKLINFYIDSSDYTSTHMVLSLTLIVIFIFIGLFKFYSHIL
jgi:hypothetical protein